ncbi:hypothetical protein UFOVP81_32 [uncultured Caudovirales phage]|uniref:Uncharacterized protein n=1 Tax=uncultured Caudovirales phage TaxID=2100421 RepID=A0A6J5KXU5_9CAUD|nr:hypothetical protein UFOVP81_32 [uncultured Caudovirales phage]
MLEDYSIGPFDSNKVIMEGIQSGDQLLAKQMELQTLARTQQRNVEAGKALMDISQSPRPDKILQVMIKYPELSKTLVDTYDRASTQEKNNAVMNAQQIFSAFNSGNPQVAKALIEQYKTAYHNAGNEDMSKRYEMLGKMTEVSPGLSSSLTAGFIHGIIGPEKFAEYIKDQQSIYDKSIEQGIALSDLKLRQTQAPVDIAMKQAQLASELKKANGPTPEIEKQQSEIYNQIEKNQYKVSDYERLAKAFETAPQGWFGNSGWGYLSKIGEKARTLAGSVADIDVLRQEYLVIKNSIASGRLNAGSASDSDVKLAQEGFPDEYSDTKKIASFLRGMSKLTSISVRADKDKAEWLGIVGSLGPTKKDILINGVFIPQGTSYSDHYYKNILSPYFNIKPDEQKTLSDSTSVPSNTPSVPENTQKRPAQSSGSYMRYAK